MGMLDTVKNWLRQIAEVGLMLIAAAVVLEIIFGGSSFLGVSILCNYGTICTWQSGLVGLISIAVIVWLAIVDRISLNKGVKQ